MHSLYNNLPKIRGRYRLNADLSKLCWLGVGGRAAVLFVPLDLEDLVYFLSNKSSDLPIFMLGAGSNILIRHSGFDGVVIRLGRAFNYVHHNSETLVAGGATLDTSVAEYAMDNSIAGLEFLSGIPGTIGGALTMNAGAYGREVKDVLVSTKVVDIHGNIKELSVDQMGYKYRESEVINHIFIEAAFSYSIGDKSRIQDEMLSIRHKRESTQPIRARTAGSTFKNPDADMKAWQLIDQAGCRGFRVGGAVMSEKHCNFINLESEATALDVEKLVFEVQMRVFEKSGVLLEPEIKILGQDVI
ncbi:UDP-N-acetylenolpyruvoylglucosamine reductase [Candidatus Cyrtobacter comes]|uniref:UDP-N-acetylenolpyruvoylglucosamine reductase n=1 Tax=Candidatus Cyrtobacter comes TaxID=675776 RepID=A0ABU5L7P6_9RICK|nr:UDP-N-acetylmuramate dehydrogenase [Candidatus Cyrtobacter comes]MDZ5762152.1 UDP-N-acetylenolpyruvoylglucosamine reductase [Candidatus Cyrtobacter comes]